MENVVLDVTDLNTGVLCSWAVLEERLKPGENSKELWVLDGIVLSDSPEEAISLMSSSGSASLGCSPSHNANINRIVLHRLFVFKDIILQINKDLSSSPG